MQGELELLKIPQAILQNMNIVWTFLLLMTRFTGFFILVPGLGAGVMGITVRMPAIIVLSYASLLASQHAPLPPDWGIVIAALVSELIFGLILGLVPYLIVAGAQTAGHLAGTSMGLGQAQLIDPTSGGSVSELSKLYGDLVILVFLLLGGHHVAVYAVSGLGGDIIPGTFNLQGATVELIINRSADIFKVGMLLSAPVVVALLLTQFVMGLISKAVPSINIFVVSFPITAGIGLMLTLIALPSATEFIARQTTTIENVVVLVSENSKRVEAVP